MRKILYNNGDKMTTILMVRHGESEANRNKVFAGNLDADLQHRGEKQAQKTAEFIANTYKVDKIYASDLKRAFKTGKALADLVSVEIVPDCRLREINAGKWEGETFDDLEKKYPEEYTTWRTDLGNARCTEGESTRELGERILAILTEIAEQNDGKTVVIATHATPVRAMQTHCIYGGFGRMQDVKWVSNASVSEFFFENGKFSCGKISQDEHLCDLRTVLAANV